jgi:hypothetical protein
MRLRITTVALTTLLAVANSHATSGDTEIRAALRAWQPNLFGTGSVIRGPLDVATVEKEGLKAVRDCAHCPQVPFGYMNRYWQDFKHELRPGDLLVFFRSDSKSWGGLYGREGYAILRKGKVVKVMIGVLS